MSAAPRPRGKAIAIAFVLSFLVYLTPLFHVHAGLMPLAVFWGGLADPSALTFAMLGAALALQAAFGAFIYWVVQGFRWWKALMLVIALPVIGIGTNLAFLVAIPLLVLVEPDRQPEVGELSPVCSLPDASLAQVHSGSALALERAGEAWITLHDGLQRAILTMPGCRAVPVETGERAPSIDQVAPGGYLLFTRRNGGLAYLAPGLEEPLAVEPPPGERFWEPVLSDDGRAVAWRDRQPGEANLRGHRLRLRFLADGREAAIPIDLSPRDHLELIGADTIRGVYTLARHSNEILAVDRVGKLLWGPVSPAGIDYVRRGFRHLEHGWVAWDVYREEGRFQLVWSLAGRSGEKVIPRGRAIESVAVDPAGRLIAVSVESRLNIGSTPSAVFLFGTHDGRELYRRYYPKFARVQVAFLGSEHLAISRRENGHYFVEVFAVPRDRAGE